MGEQYSVLMSDMNTQGEMFPRAPGRARRRWFLLISTVLVFLLPFIGSVLRWDGDIPGYGAFPAQKVVEVPGFNLGYFIFMASIAALMTLFLAFPRLFGFKKRPAESQSISPGRFPIWFWVSLPIFALSWFFMWARVTMLVNLSHYSFVPLWWSFILMLDGWVYRRTGGRSLIATRPNTMKLLAVVSCLSWFSFEFLNFFVLENWYYPNNEIFTNFGNIFLFSLSYTTVLPAIFEWYTLFRSVPALDRRYGTGPKIAFPKPLVWFCYIAGAILCFAMGYFPFLLFWGVWVALIPLLGSAMSLTGYWTPLSDIARRGDWSRVSLIGLATLCNGFFWELWNFGSEWFHRDVPTNPNYWRYSVPYVDVIHIFSEMPLLGYFGYILFGVNCWILWLISSYLMGFSPDIDLTMTRGELSRL